MEYVQERVTTLHAFGTAEPSVDPGTLAETVVVVPLTHRDHGTPAATRVFSELERIAPGSVLVALRSSPDELGPVRRWLEGFDLPLEVLWCNAPAVDRLLADADVEDGSGKGRDVWLALGPAAATGEYVAVHDADARSFSGDHVCRLLAPLTMGFAFSKAYYARVEDERLYGRLCRLCYEPLVRALAAEHDAPFVEYLGAFRYALAGEFAATAALVRQLTPPHTWGLEVATLANAFDHAGFDGSAQVDLGRHEHAHRDVAGREGLEGMSRTVVATLLAEVESRGVEIEYDRLGGRFRSVGNRLLDAYEADARFNGLQYDRIDEADQVERYADSIHTPETQRRLPRWDDAPVDPGAVRRAAQPWRSTAVESRADD